jgi:hypothetical protein
MNTRRTTLLAAAGAGFAAPFVLRATRPVAA